MKNKLARRDDALGPNWFQRNKKTLALLTMVAPGAIWLLLLRYLPIGGIVLAFKNYKIFPRNPTFWSNLAHSKWVGLKNFEFIFKTDQAIVAIRNTLLYNVVFIILGCTGLSKQLNTLVPPGVKAGIVLGAGVGAVRARMLEGGAMDTATWGCLGGLIIVFLLMFSLRVRNKMEGNRALQILGNYSFLWAVLAMFIIGGIAGEFDFSGILDEGLFKAPDIPGMMMVTSPFMIGWGSPDMWVAGIPMALISWVIAYGDFITVQQLGYQAQRDDEYIEFDPNRTNVICGFRNVVIALVAGYPAQAGPLSAPYCVATYQRYKQSGRQGMDSIYDGSGTNISFTAIGLFVYPLYMAAAAAAGPMLVVVLTIQGYVCTQICFDLAFDKVDEGVAGMLAGFILARGGGVGLIAGIFLYLLLADNDKIRSDYAGNKERQRIEDEEMARQNAALQARMEAFKRGEIAADEGGTE